MALDRDDKFGILGGGLFVGVLVILGFYFRKNETPAQKLEKKQILRNDNYTMKTTRSRGSAEIRAQRDQTFGKEHYGKSPVPEVDQIAKGNKNIEPLVVIEDPDKEILKGSDGLNEDFLPEEEQTIFSVKVDKRLVENLPEDEQQEYQGNEDLDKGELKAVTEDFEWSTDPDSGEVYLRSHGGTVEIHNIDDKLMDSMHESLRTARRYADKKMGAPVSEKRKDKPPLKYQR